MHLTGEQRLRVSKSFYLIRGRQKTCYRIIVYKYRCHNPLYANVEIGVPRKESQRLSGFSKGIICP
jgi:hypothetical protein